VKINILIDQKNSFFHDYKDLLIKKIKKRNYKIKFIYSANKLKKGDILFIIATNKILNKKSLSLHNINLNIHPSKLPQGRGSAAVSWNILRNKSYFYITLHEAKIKVDSGKIYIQEKVKVKSHELNTDIRKRQAIKTIEIINKFLKNREKIKPRVQKGKVTFLKKRLPKDSLIDINKSLKSQFNLLRVVDNNRYPAFFYNRKTKYILKIFREIKQN
jgi:methionyl-tRNA formyltransferase